MHSSTCHSTQLCVLEEPAISRGHYAGILNSEADWALTAGVNAMMSSQTTIKISQLQARVGTMAGMAGIARIGCTLVEHAQGFAGHVPPPNNRIRHPQPCANAQALSPVGRCQTFDAAVDGYGRGEGFAVVVLRASDPHAAEDGTAASGLFGVIQVL